MALLCWSGTYPQARPCQWYGVFRARTFLLQINHCDLKRFCIGFQVINAPSEALSAVQLDALKHLLVISLLGNGRWSGVPKSSSLLLRAANSSAFEPYNKLAKLYASDGVNLDQLHAYCTECEEIFRKVCVSANDLQSLMETPRTNY